MYRKAVSSPPAPDPSCVVLPGEGLRGIWVGHAIPDEVLATFGSDADVARYKDGDLFQISYDDLVQPASASRPRKFHFEHGLLKRIDVGPYQKALLTDAGLRIGSTRDDVLATMGDPSEKLHYRGALLNLRDDIDTLRYRTRGIQFAIHDDGRVASFGIFQTRRRD